MIMLYMKHMSESVYPYQVFISGGTARDRGTQMETIDEWCYAQWGPDPDEFSDWNLMTSGWGFKQESDALLLMMTWS